MEKHNFKLELGKKAKSNISSFEGIITARCQHLNGCDRYFINPKVAKDGILTEGYWFDEGELVILKSKKIRPQNQELGGFPSAIK